MQEDMHFYGTYALARIAGFPPDPALTVATAAQFVDDAVEASPVHIRGRAYLLPVVSAHTMMERENFDRMDHWRVWVPFHFLPGGQGVLVEDRLVCLWGEPGNEAADSIIRLALEAGAAREPYGLHLLGIVTHVIQDTYAHYGFSGVAHEHNRVRQQSIDALNLGRMRNYVMGKLQTFWDRLGASVAEASLLGHAGVATFPDRPYMRWRFQYEQAPSGIRAPYLRAERDNQATYLLACTRLHAVFHAYLAGMTGLPQGHRPFSRAVNEEIQSILAEEGTKEERRDRWLVAIQSGRLFDPVAEDLTLKYSGRGWGMQTLTRAQHIEATEAYWYNRAARHYLEAIHDDILPRMHILER